MRNKKISTRWALAGVCAVTASLVVAADPAGAKSPRPAQASRLALATSMHSLNGIGVAGPRVSGLPALLRQSVSSDPQVLSAAALADAAEDRVTQARSAMLPVLGIQVQRSSEKLEIHERPERRKTDRAAATLNMNLFNAGLDQAELDASQREAEAAREDLRRAREEVSERIAGTYAQALRYYELLPESDARLERARKLDEQVFTQVQAGKLSDIDGVQSAITLLEAEVDHAELHSEAMAALARLAEMTGRQVDLAAGWPDVLLEPGPLAAGTSLQPSVLTAAELRAEAAHSRVPALASLYAPKIDLQYERPLHDRSEPHFPERRRDSWSVFARWDIPLGGGKHAQHSESSHRARAADEEVARVHQSLRSELAGMPGQIRTSRAVVERLQDQVERYKTLVNAGALQFEAGRRNLEQLAQLGQNSFASHRRLADERLKLRSTVVRQLSVSGGLLERLGIGDTADTAQ